MKAEKSTYKGRSDVVFETPKHVYIVECKKGKSADSSKWLFR